MCDPCGIASRFTDSKAGVVELNRALAAVAGGDDTDEEVSNPGGSEAGAVEDTAEDERDVTSVGTVTELEGADMLIDATGGEVLLDGDGDGLGGKSNTALGEFLVIGVVEVQALEPEHVDVELVPPADLGADAGAVIGLLEAGGEPAAAGVEADRALRRRPVRFP